MVQKCRAVGAIFAAAVLSATCGFALHVFTVEIVTSYVALIMAGRQVAPSWDVRIPAALTSIEQGLALALLSLLVRSRMPSIGSVRRGFLVGVFALALSGNLVRFPFILAHSSMT